MGAYNFKQQFESDILADIKRQTIRARRRYPDKSGSTLHLFVGMKTKRCRLLKRRRCLAVHSIDIYAAGRVHIELDGVILSLSECEALARADGFKNFRAFAEYWAADLPFSGDLLMWESDEAWRRRETGPRVK